MSSSRAVRTQRAALLAIGDEVLRGEISNTQRRVHRGAAVRGWATSWRSRWWSPTIRSRSGRRWSGCAPRSTSSSRPAASGRPRTTGRSTSWPSCSVTGTVADEPSLEAMKKRFSTHGFEMTPNNLRQVRIPNGAQGAAQHGRDRARVRRAAGRRGGVLPAGRAARDGEDVHRRGDAAAGAPPGRGGRCRAPATRTWHLYGMGESHIDHRLAGILTGIEGATLHFRTSNPVNHVKLVVRRDDEAEARGDAREGRRRAAQADRPRHLRRRRRHVPGGGRQVAEGAGGDAGDRRVVHRRAGGRAGHLGVGRDARSSAAASSPTPTR